MNSPSRSLLEAGADAWQVRPFPSGNALVDETSRRHGAGF
jgi:hypothetical protein